MSRKDLYIFSSLRNHYDYRVLEAFENGDTALDLDISEDSLEELHKAAQLLDFMDVIESMSNAELDDLDALTLDILTELYREYAYELEDLYLNWYCMEFEF